MQPGHALSDSRTGSHLALQVATDHYPHATFSSRGSQPASRQACPLGSCLPLTARPTPWERGGRNARWEGRSGPKQVGLRASQDAQRQHGRFQGLVQASDSQAEASRAPLLPHQGPGCPGHRQAQLCSPRTQGAHRAPGKPPLRSVALP